MDNKRIATELVKTAKLLVGGEWCIRWTEFDRNDRLVGKQKCFSSEEARNKFREKQEKKDNFNEWGATSDPK